MLVECYDVGGTYLRQALIRDGNIESLVKRESGKNIFNQIRYLSNESRKEYKPSAVSIALPGPVENGLLLKSPPLKIENPVNVRLELSDLSDNLYIQNDMNAAVLAEKEYGIGKKFNSFYLLTFSSGIGAGIVIDGKPLLDSSGEFGHSVLERRPSMLLECDCGNKGCWSAYCSGKGIKNLAKKVFDIQESTIGIFNLASSGNEDAKRVLNMVKSYNAHGLANMVNAIETERIVIMGSLGLSQFDRIIPRQEEIRHYTINRVPEIVKTSLGDNIGLLGAYLLAAKS